MLVESISILMILAVIIFIFARAHRRDYVTAVLPLLVVPLFHTIALLLNDVVPLITLSADIQAAVDVVAMAVSVAALGIISTRYKTKKKRYSYLLVCGGFSALLTLIYLYNIYLPA